MIKNLIFDFGDIFINLDKGVVLRGIEKYGGTDITDKLKQANDLYEVGGISSEEFVSQLQTTFPKASSGDIVDIWNSMLLDLPDYRLNFIENLSREGDYRLFLLSNTNAMHIPHFIEKVGLEKYNRFRNCFEQFYLSHEIKLRKPTPEIFNFVLDQNGLVATETFFIDDSKENTDAAEALGIHTWNLLVGQEDVTNLKSKL